MGSQKQVSFLGLQDFLSESKVMGDMDSRPTKKQKVLPKEQKVSFMELPFDAMDYLQSMFKRKRNRSESDESPHVEKQTRADPDPLPKPPKMHNHQPAKVDTDNMAAYQYMIYMNQRSSLD